MHPSRDEAIAAGERFLDGDPFAADLRGRGWVHVYARHMQMGADPIEVTVPEDLDEDLILIGMAQDDRPPGTA